MHLWGIGLLLSAVAATGSCLQCISCSGLDSCVNSTVTSCPDGDVCALRHRISVIGNATSQHIDRFCAHPSECNGTGTFDRPNIVLDRMATTCCDENLCTSTKPAAPNGSSLANGMKCPSCSWLSYPSCDILEWMNCVGDETMCLLKTTKQNTGSLNFTTIDRGCASKGFCYIRNENSTSGAVYTETTYSCSPASRAPYTAASTATIGLSSLLSLSIILVKYVDIF
ncbi:phospholipase A2 inhibitor NAI-like [Dendropsophus ebraccatus]|uniref:phospholipase A2 inhibitor NAI-like n=1 Tax=Dendropsophus ebraccatus TaxID=150705 RepID=UPI0038316219